MATKKKVVKKPLPPSVRAMRKTVMPYVCRKWKAKLRKARTAADLRRLWGETDHADRHEVLSQLTDNGPGECLACKMGGRKVMRMPFKDVLVLMRALAKRYP